MLEHAAMAEWSIALDCKSGALRASKVQILLAAPNKNIPSGCFFGFERLAKLYNKQSTPEQIRNT